jgi:hypothetical protein
MKAEDVVDKKKLLECIDRHESRPNTRWRVDSDTLKDAIESGELDPDPINPIEQMFNEVAPGVTFVTSGEKK